MVLLTGGTGMLGSYLLFHLLAQGEKVKAVKRKSSGFEITKTVFSFLSDQPDDYFSRIEWIDLDLNNQDDLALVLPDIDDVYHCAAIINYSSKNPEWQIENNREITKNLVDASLEYGVKRFCHVSSIAALGSSYGQLSVKESDLWDNSEKHTHYAISKYQSEMEVWRAMVEGLNAVIVNPSVILGVGDWHKGAANLIHKVAKGFKFFTRGSTGFVDARDVASLCYLLMQNDKYFGERYIINAENKDYPFVFGLIANQTHQKAPSIYASPFLTGLAWRYEKVKGYLLNRTPLISKASARTAHKKLQYDNRKLLEIMPFEYISVEKSLIDICDFYLRCRQVQ